MRRGWHVQKRLSRRGVHPASGRELVLKAWGVRVGSWPCLDAYFAELSLGGIRLAVWYGRPAGQNVEA